MPVKVVRSLMAERRRVIVPPDLEHAMEAFRRLIQKQIHQLVGPPSRQIEPPRPPGDLGLFAPDTMVRTVHGDFTTMMVGGISALLLQMLHPGALAGVWDHSDFRRDMLGRLKRTAQFISGTTYGSTARALGLIEHVRQVHDRVHGTMPDGTPYSAHDPALLTWVHVAEMDSFLRAYIRYRDPGMTIADQDRYFSEVATIAERLGALSVPKTRRAVEAYLTQIRPHLRCDARTREVANALLGQKLPGCATEPFRRLVMDAGLDLLPGWAARMHGARLRAPNALAARIGVTGLGFVIRQALRSGANRQQAPKTERPL